MRRAGSRAFVQILVAVLFPTLASTRAHAQPLGADGIRSPMVLELGRCLPSADAACFRVRGNEVAGRNDASARFRGYLDTLQLLGPATPRRAAGINENLRLLVLFDVSGSMLNGNSIAVTRSPLRAFLTGLPPAVTAAVVPFESRQVRQAFDSVSFASPDRVGAQLDRLPMPRKDGNTALYSAISFGLQALDNARPTATRSALVVITDGSNDVGHRGDDPGLLDAASGGRERVQQLIANSPHQLWLIGAGSGVRVDELKALAGTRGSVLTAPMDPAALLEQYEQIGNELMPARLLGYGLPASARSDLGRRSRHVRISDLSDSLALWRPPLVALPPFVHTLDSTLLSTEARQVALAADSDLSLRLLVGGPLLAVLTLLYLVLPRLLASAGSTSGAPSAAVATGASERAPPGGAAGLLRTAVEAPPRSPTDITSDQAA